LPNGLPCSAFTPARSTKRIEAAHDVFIILEVGPTILR
jgi:hypothetical protein